VTEHEQRSACGGRCGCYEPRECLCITPDEAAEMTAEELAEVPEHLKAKLT
jgi:hypothetical protein